MNDHSKAEVNVTELRQNLPAYLARARGGTEIEVISRGKVIARIVAAIDPAQEARDRLVKARAHCRVGDVTSPINDTWDADR